MDFWNGKRRVSAINRNMRQPVVNPKITSHFGPRLNDWHMGTDFISLDNNRAVIAVTSGVVIGKGYEPANKITRMGAGHFLKVRYDYKKRDGRYFDALLAHFREPSRLKVGDRVNEGDVIAFYGESGYTFGPHLHVTVYFDGRIVDPLWILNDIQQFDEEKAIQEHIYKLMYSKLANHQPSEQDAENFYNDTTYIFEKWDREINRVKEKIE